MFSSFIKSQLIYCSLVWMFCTKHSIGRINSIHEWCLRLIQQNYASGFEVLLENGNENQVHQKCIELLMIQVFKYLNGLSHDIMSDILKLRENTYNLTHFHIFESQSLRTKRFGLDSIAYSTSQLWKNVPDEIRNSTSLLWLLKCCKNRNFYYMFYIHVISSFILIIYFIFMLHVLLYIYYIFICTLYLI